MGHMKFEHTKPYEDHFWKKNRIDLVFKHVSAVDDQHKVLMFSDGTQTSYDKLVLATGAKPNMFGWKGQDLKGVGGLFSFQDLERMEKYTKNIKRGVIIGGGLIGVEMAEMLLSRGIEVTFLIRESLFWGNVLPEQEAKMVMRHMKEHHVDLRVNTELSEIIGNDQGRAIGIKTNKGEFIECGWVGLTAGVSPNISFLASSKIETNRGILIDQEFQTNIKDIYAIGDCAEFKTAAPGRRPIEQVWYTGKMMGENLAKCLTGAPTPYAPGHWFNSAKFFDIEYQTYGWVFPKLKSEETDFYWEHESGKICVHLIFEKQSRQFVGINTFGIRMRHQAFDYWLNKQTSIETVIENLKDANFDPEFYSQYEQEIVNQFNNEQGTSLSVKKKSWKRILNFIR